MLTRTDPQSGLQIEVEFRQYRAFPAVEWLARLRNTGSADTAIIADVQSMSIMLPPMAVLHYHMGDYYAADGYEPHTAAFQGGADLRFAPDGGRPTNRAWPYYNIEWPTRQCGTFLVVGWSGQWASRFRSMDDHVAVTAGQELTHFKLHPGETVRTPLSVLLFWRGDRLHAHNLWRRWMLACNLPRPGGQLPQPMLPAYTGRWFAEMAEATEETQIAFPDALAWVIEHTARTIVEQGIDLYRQNFNIDPLPYWRANDAPDRQGIREIRYVEGYLSFWQALRTRFPNMLIDSCASGGRRNDLETMRLSVPLHKTDYDYGDLPTKQAFHHSLSLWLPYYGAYVLPVDTVDVYSFQVPQAGRLRKGERVQDSDRRPDRCLYRCRDLCRQRLRQ